MKPEEYRGNFLYHTLTIYFLTLFSTFFFYSMPTTESVYISFSFVSLVLFSYITRIVRSENNKWFMLFDLIPGLIIAICFFLFISSLNIVIL